MADIPLTKIVSKPRHIVKGTDANGKFVIYEISDDAFRKWSLNTNDPPPGLTFEEWHSGPPGGFGRYVVSGETQVFVDHKLATFVMVGEVAEEDTFYSIGAPKAVLTIPKADLTDPADFSSLSDKSQLIQFDVLDITATTLTVKD